MMPDDHFAEGPSEADVTELVGLVGNAFAREGLSPPSQLYSAIRQWRGLSRGEILQVLDQHFYHHRQRYLCGSGDGLFPVLQAAIRQAIETKRPRQPEPDRERVRRPRHQVVTLHNPSGVNDVYVEGVAAHLVRDLVSNVDGPSVMPGYEAGGEPIGDGDD